jgi:nucleoside-diphosphate-sugar epimerase
MKTFVLTGIAGFVGSGLAKTLVQSGHRVVGIKRRLSDTGRLNGIHKHITLYDVEGLNFESVLRELAPVEAIVHAATCYGRRHEGFSEILASNTVFPLHLLEAATCSNDFGRFVNIDTVLEGSTNAYALSKKQFLAWGKYLSQVKGTSFINVRMEHIFGPLDNKNSFASQIIRSCLTGCPVDLTLGEQRRDFIYIDDAVEALRLLVEPCRRLREGFIEVSCGSGESISIRAFVETIHKMTNSRSILRFGVMPYRKEEVMESKADVTFLKELGWRGATKLEEGIARTIESERRHF